MQRIALVTGASGYLGQPLTRLLTDRGWLVRAVARTRPADLLPAQWHQPEPVRDATGSAIAHAWQPADADFAGVDTVFHLAGIAHQQGQSEPDKYHQANALASNAIAQRAATHGVRRLLFVSSVSAMGPAPQAGILSPDTPLQPMTSYGQSKAAAESQISQTLANTACALTIVRPPLVYGPHPKGNLALLIRLLMTGLPLPLGGIANQRSMIAAPNLLALLADLATDPRSHGKVLIPSDITLSTPALIDKLCAALGRPSRLFSVPAWLFRHGPRLPLVGARLGHAVDPLLTSLQVEDSFLTDTMGWQPGVPPDKVFARMVQSVRQREQQQ